MNFIELYFDAPTPEHDTSAEYHANLRRLRVLTPEDKLTNVIKALVEQVNAPSYRYRMDGIRDTVHQLAERWNEYQQWINGDEAMPLLIDDDLPF